MTDISTAIRNNVEWCDLVYRAHGVRSRTMQDKIWVAIDRPPALYPDLITTEAHSSSKLILDLLDGRGSCSAKDSFASLDLQEGGFFELFDAQWICLDPKPGGTAELRWSTIDENDHELIGEWEKASGIGRFLTPALFHEPSVRVFLAQSDDTVVGGAIANMSPSAVGVSNVFTTTDDHESLIWNDLATIVGEHFPGLPLVGYEHGESLEAAQSAGFSDLGPLRIWLRE